MQSLLVLDSTDFATLDRAIALSSYFFDVGF
jgi:hypothetical protein